MQTRFKLNALEYVVQKILETDIKHHLYQHILNRMFIYLKRHLLVALLKI